MVFSAYGVRCGAIQASVILTTVSYYHWAVFLQLLMREKKGQCEMKSALGLGTSL